MAKKIIMSPLIQHALVLHLYQSPDSLQRLLQQNEEELRSILLCYERIARHAYKYADVARVHVVFSVPLLEQLRSPELIDRCRHLVDIPAILEAFRSASNIEFIGSGYQHAPLPLIPREDWDEQLRADRAIAEEVFGHVPKGYWPPEALFSMEMVPALAAAGYEYVLLGSSTLMTENDQPVDPYRTYQLSHKGDSITVVPWDAGFSYAQEHGMDAPWLADELRNGVLQSPASEAPYLLTSCSDGENSEWFRGQDEEGGFFGRFFSPYMEFCETGEFPIQPVSLTRRIHSYPAKLMVALRNDISSDRSTWNYPGEQGAVFDRLFAVSQRYWTLVKTGGAAKLDISREVLAQARKLMLQAQGSCYLLGQDKCIIDLLDQVESLLGAEKKARAGVRLKKKENTIPKSKKQPVTAKKISPQMQTEDEPNELSQSVDAIPSSESSSAVEIDKADTTEVFLAGRKIITTPPPNKTEKKPSTVKKNSSTIKK
jgi:hypothetical protein